MRPIDFIVVHHTDSPETTTVDDVWRWHVLENGWSDVGYHYLIHQTDDGQWVSSEARHVDRVGSHDQGANVGSIGVAVAGRYDRTALSIEARRVLIEQIYELCVKYNLTSHDVYGHSERAPRESGLDNTTCPGFDMRDVRAWVGIVLALRSNQVVFVGDDR